MNYVIALLIVFVVVGFAVGTLRGLVRPGRELPKPDEAVPVLDAGRVTFWCSNCGTELLLLRRGTDAAPRHCGEPMIRREEVPGR